MENKKIILYVLLIGGFLLISIFSILFYSNFIVFEPSCGEEYNFAFKSALEGKDISFCGNKDHIPKTAQWSNGIITENICKNYDGERIRVDEETCVETFVKHYNQPQLCTLLPSLSGKSLYGELSEKDKNIVNQYVNSNEIILFQGVALNCVYEYIRERDSLEGCQYLDKDSSKGNSVEEICIQYYNSLYSN